MNSKRLIALSLTLFSSMVCAAGTASAEEPSPADQAAARALLESAATARSKNDFATCRDQAGQAWKQFHHAQIAGLLGLCEVELGQYREGAGHLSEFLKTAVNVPEEGKREAAAALAKAKVHLAEVTVACTPGATEIFIDGQSVGPAPTTVYLEPGDHSIEAKKEGYEGLPQKKSLLASTELKVDIILNPIGPEVRGHKPVWPYIVGGVVAAAGLGVGIAGTVVAHSKATSKNDLADSTTCKPVSQACLTQGNDLAKKQGTFQTMGTTGFIVGGVALVGTLIYLAVPAPRKNPNAARVRFLPVISPTGSGLWVDGSF